MNYLCSSWEYFPHDDARSRVYRWGEDGLLGITDSECCLCLALCVWNEKDPILKERLFGLTGNEVDIFTTPLLLNGIVDIIFLILSGYRLFRHYVMWQCSSAAKHINEFKPAKCLERSFIFFVLPQTAILVPLI